jgi:GNAT superfamily N-acetyltransferase
MSQNVILRPARRSDTEDLAHIANAANAKSAIHKRVAPWQNEYPINYYLWRRNIVRQRFATPDVRTIVAEDATTGQILGQATWGVEGAETKLYKEWTANSTWSDWFEAKLIDVEKTWAKWVTNRCIDYSFMNSFLSALFEKDRQPRPPCLHCHLIVVDPRIQSKGVGKMLIDWGKALAVKEDLPLYLEANLEATGFYEKGGFSRLTPDLVIDPGKGNAVHIPVYMWEGDQRRGKWLMLDKTSEGPGKRWRWKDDVVVE